MKRGMLFLTAAMFTVSCFGVKSFGADFSDINNVPWEGAKPYINSVADLGLMIGDIHPQTGKKIFRAKDKVTFCETTQLSYIILKNAGKLKPSSTNLTSKWLHVLKSYNIPDWAHESVAYALENEALTLTDVSWFMSKNGSVVSNNYASRESVAVIFGKMLAQVYPLKEQASLNFGDTASISVSSIPYIELLSRLGIMVGDTDNNFTPKAYINRAEMAVLTSKAYNVVTGSAQTPAPPTESKGEFSGNIASIEDYGGNKLMTVKSTAGTQQGFIVTPTTYLVKGDSQEQLSTSTLRVGDSVKIDFEGAKVNVIRLYSDIGTSNTEEKGVVDEITNTRIYLINSSDKVNSYNLSEKCTWTLDGKSASMKNVFDAIEEKILTATITLDRDGYVTAAKITTEEDAGTTGTLVSIDNDEISFKEGSSSKVTSKEWTNKMEVELEGKTSTISKVQDAAVKNTLYVKVYTDSRDRVRKALVSADKFSSKDSKDTITGTVRSLYDDKIKIKRLSNSDTETYDFSDDIKYYLDDEDSSYRKVNSAYISADDDGKDFYVRVELNSKGDVIKLYASKDKNQVTGAEYKDTIDCKLVYITNTEIRYDDDDDKETLDLSSDADLYLDSKTATVKEIEAARNKEGTLYATLYVTKDDVVVKVEASVKRTSASKDQDGTINSMTKDTIQLKGGKKLDLDSDVDIEWDDEDISVSKFLKAVDDRDVTITAKLKVKNGIVSSIEAYTQEIKGELSELSARDRTMTIETRDFSYDLRLKSGSVTCTGTFKDIRELDNGFNYDSDDFDVTATLDEGRVVEVYAKRQ